MRDLVDFLVRQFIAQESYDIIMLEDENAVEIKVQVDKDMISKLIGRGGRIAKSIRSLVKAKSGTLDKRYSLTIEERDA